MRKRMKKIKCIITGANGFVGSTIVDYLEKKKLIVCELGRKPYKTIINKNFTKYSLGDLINPYVFKDVDVFIHCAYDFKLRNWKEIHRTNVLGSIQILETAKNAGVKKIIFISSLSSFETAKSKYGKAKFSVEEKVKDFTHIIRPGLIYDENSRSLVGAFKRLIKISPIIPLISKGNQVVYTCHSEDLARLIWVIIQTNKKITGPIVAANQQNLTFKKFLEVLSENNGKKRVFIRIPYFTLYAMLRIIESLSLNLGLRSDSLIALVNYNRNVYFTNTNKLGMEFRKFH